jgi:hypothetical protein
MHMYIGTGSSELEANELINNDGMNDSIRKNTDNGYSDPMNIFEVYIYMYICICIYIYIYISISIYVYIYICIYT